MRGDVPGQESPGEDGLDVTVLLARWRSGDAAAADALMPHIYNELRLLARRRLLGRKGASLQPTELVAEVYLKLVRAADVEWRDRAHFFSAAAQAMRQILVDRYRRRKALRRGADAVLLSWRESVMGGEARTLELDRLEDALVELEALDPRQAELVTLKFFGGLKSKEIAEVLGISERTVKREWAAAKLWLYRRLSESS